MALEWYTFGGGQELTDLLMNITMLARSGGFINLIDLLMMTGLFFAFILAAFSGRIFSTPIRNFVIMMIVVYGLLKPASDVMVIDERTGQNYNVSNVPLGVALFGYFQSSLSRDLVNFFEGTLNGGSFYASYAKYGFGFGPFSTKAIVEFMNSPAISNENPDYGRLVTNLSRFSQECFGYSAAQGNNFAALMAIKAMPASNDAFKIFLGQDQSYPYINSGLTMDYVNSDNSVVSEDCKTAGAQIYSDILRLVHSSQSDQNFVNQVQGMLSANPATLSPDLQTALQYHFNSLSQLENLKMNILFSSMAYDFVKLGASGLSNNPDVSNYALNSVLGSAKMSAIQQAVENFGQGAIAVALAPKMLNFTKMMYYLLFFVLLTLALTPLARAIGKVVLVFFVFLTILEPLYVLLNYLLNTMAYYQASSSTTCNNSPAGILSCLDINSLFYTNILNFSILGLIGLAYMLASAMVTGSGAVIGAIGEKFGSGAITYQGANNNIGSLSNFVNDPLKWTAAQGMNMGSFIADGGAGFQSSLANYMATQAAMRGTELGASLATYNSMRGTVTKDGYTNIDGVKYSNVAVDKSGHVSDFNTAGGTLGQLVRGFANSGNISLAKLGASLEFLKNRLGEGVSATVIKGENGYTVKFNMGDAGTRGEQSIIIGKDGRFIKGNINTGDGNSISITDDGRVLINGKEAAKDIIDAQKSFEDLKTVTLGHNLAKKLGLKVSEAEARLIGNIASKSHNFQEFVRNLTDLLTSYAHKDGRKDGHSAGESHDSSSSYGFKVDPGALVSLVSKIVSKITGKGGKGGGGDGDGSPVSLYYREENKNKVSEGKYEEKGTDNSKDRNVKEGVGVGTLDSFIKELKHLEQDSRTNTIIKEKDFEDVKKESYDQVYREAEKATFAKRLEEQYGIALTGQALEKLEEAVKSGDTGRILAVLADIAADAKNWKTVEASQYQDKKEQVQTRAGQAAGNVSQETTNVPKQTEDSAAAAKEAQEKAAKAEGVPENLNVNTGDPFGSNFHIKAPKGFYKDAQDVKQQVEKELMKNVTIKDFENPQKVLPHVVDFGQGAVKAWREGIPSGTQSGNWANWTGEFKTPTPPQAKDVSKGKNDNAKRNR
jgi:hypothetical protein